MRHGVSALSAYRVHDVGVTRVTDAEQAVGVGLVGGSVEGEELGHDILSGRVAWCALFRLIVRSYPKPLKKELLCRFCLIFRQGKFHAKSA